MTFNELARVHQEQLTEFDCGPACLSMLAKYLSIPVQYSDIRKEIRRNDQGVSLKAMIECAERMGIVLTALKGALADLKKELKPFVLVVKNEEGLHFVTAWHFGKNSVWISDPAEGRPKKQSWEELGRQWTCYGLRLETIPKHPVQKGNTPWFRWFQHEKHLLAGIAIGTFLLSVLAFSGVYFSKWLLDSALPSGTDLLKPFIILGGILLFSGGLGALRDFGLILHFERFNGKELKRQFEKLWNLSTDSFDTYSTGDLLARLQDFRRIQSIITEFISGVGIQLVLIVLISFVLIVLQPMLVWPVILPIPWYFLWAKPRSQKLNEQQKNSLKSKAFLENNYWQWLNFRSYWKVSGQTRSINDQHQQYLGKWINNRRELSKELLVLNYSFESVSILGFLAVLNITTSAYRHDQLSLGALIACISLWGMLSPAWKSSISWYPRWIEAQWVWKRVAGWENEEKKPLKSIEVSPEASFSWSRGRSLSFDKPTIDQGSIIQLCGPSGCGKTTLIRLLSDDLEWTRGSGWGHCEWFPQETPILSGTIADNLLVHASDQLEWTRAMEVWEMWGLTNWIDRMPLKWSTPIGKGGRALSGGQKQLIAWMRVVKSNKKIWLLDEPTAHLDEQWTNRLLKKLYQTRNERAVLLVSHRTSEINFNPTGLWEMKMSEDGNVFVQ